MDLNTEYKKIGLKIPHILFPNENVDLNKFAVIAADQFSAEPKYWDKVSEYTKDSVSSINLIFPEARMPITNDKIVSINNNMKTYISNNYLKDIGESLIFVKRETTTGIRNGLIVAIDLEQYDYENNSDKLIRSTEATVKERLPIRVDIRRNAYLDIPHTILMINDNNNYLFGYLNSVINKLNNLYDFDLMFNNQHISGYQIKETEILTEIYNIFDKLKNEAKDNLLFAVGDGNHSLASAKICYEEEKQKILSNLSDEQKKNKEYVESILTQCKKRYSLVEVVNIFDESIKFFPIHRLLINCNKENFEKETNIKITDNVPLQDLQIIIDKYLLNHPEVKLEYIHGKENCEELGKLENNISIILDDYKKDGFFNDIIKYGSLCRKSFSIGNNIDKRFYLESMSYI